MPEILWWFVGTLMLTVAIVGTLLSHRANVLASARTALPTSEGLSAAERLWSVRSVSESPHTISLLDSKAMTPQAIVRDIDRILEVLPPTHKEAIAENARNLHISRALRTRYSATASSVNASDKTSLADAAVLGILAGLGPEGVGRLSEELATFAAPMLLGVAKHFEFVSEPFAETAGEAVGNAVEHTAESLGDLLPVDIPIFTLAKAAKSAYAAYEQGLDDARVAENAMWDIAVKGGGIALGGMIGGAILPGIGTFIGALAGGIIGHSGARSGKQRHLNEARREMVARMRELGAQVTAEHLEQLAEHSRVGVEIKDRHLDLFITEVQSLRPNWRERLWMSPGRATVLAALEAGTQDVALERAQHQALVVALESIRSQSDTDRGMFWALMQKACPYEVAGPDLTPYLPAVEKVIQEQHALTLGA